MSAGEGKKSALVPKLRFPEFRNAEGWKPKLLGEVCGMQAGKFIAASEISEKQSEGLHPCFGGNGLRGYTNNYNQSGRYSLIGRQGALCGNVNLVEGDFYATEHAVVTTPKVGISTDWNFYNLCLLNLNRFATGQAQPGLSVDVLEKVNCAVPKDEEEQQKIADCLSSLDELIAAQGRKVEALKTYKRGLMQQLFPREGETLPRLRFPEFRDAPEWIDAPLGDLFDTSSGGTPDRSKRDYWNGDIPWITTSLVDFNVITKADEFISETGLDNSSAKVFPQGTVLVAMYGQGITRGKVAMLGIPAATNQACAAILPNDQVDNGFTFVSLCGRYEEMRKLSNSGGQENLSQALIRALPFRYPKDVEEQTRIVECFSEIDALIVGEVGKLDALKLHKDGLMQQLFPSLEEA